MAAQSPEAKARKAQRRKEREAAGDPKAIAYRARKNKRHNARKEEKRKERGISRDKRRSPEAMARKNKRTIQRRSIERQAFNSTRPFVGCDGEGARDAAGPASYVLFRIGKRELCRDGARLTTPELLSFILGHPSPDDILVGFFFEYDVSNILYDVPPARDPKRPAEPSQIEKILQVDLKAAAG